MTVDSLQPSLSGMASPKLLPIDGPNRIGGATVSYRDARDILTRASGFMGEYDFTLNPYSGCTFGCTYCYAAFFSTTKEQRDTWGDWVLVKRNAPSLLYKRKPGALDGKLIYMSSVTDPYQPVDRELNLTRTLLEIMAERHKVKLVVQTRSPDVTRDSDLYQRIEENGGRVQINMTITTDDETVRRTFEPRCPSNARRMDAMKQLRANGIEGCITMTPLLWVDDPEGFAQDLLDTGVQRFIAQPFHFQRGKFVANTRQETWDLMADKLGCTVSEFRPRYLKHYENVFRILRDALPELGEGKDGFKPPF